MSDKKQMELKVEVIGVLHMSSFSRVNALRANQSFDQAVDKTGAEQYFFRALIGEIGEAAGLLKARERALGSTGWSESKSDITKWENGDLGGELADIFIYLDLWASSMGINLQEEVIKKFNKVSDKIDSNIKIMNQYGKL